MLETSVWSLSWEDPMGESMATHSSILAWRIPWIEKPGRLQSTGLDMTEWLTLSLSNPLWHFLLCDLVWVLFLALRNTFAPNLLWLPPFPGNSGITCWEPSLALAIYAVIFSVSFCNFLHLWGSSILRGCTVVCFFSLLYNISFDVYTKICLSSIQLVDVWVFFQVFAIPSHPVMRILTHVFWCK